MSNDVYLIQKQTLDRIASAAAEVVQWAGGLTPEQVTEKLIAIPRRQSSDCTITNNVVRVPEGLFQDYCDITVGTAESATTYTPGTTNQTIAAGSFLTGAQTILGDADLVAGNIKSGVQIFGVTGTYVGEAPKIKDSLSITPSASAQSFDAIDEGYAGYAYVSVAGDADLVAGNIKSGVNIFGVTGTYEGGGSYLAAESYTF